MRRHGGDDDCGLLQVYFLPVRPSLGGRADVVSDPLLAIEDGNVDDEPLSSLGFDAARDVTLSASGSRDTASPRPPTQLAIED